MDPRNEALRKTRCGKGPAPHNIFRMKILTSKLLARLLVAKGRSRKAGRHVERHVRLADTAGWGEAGCRATGGAQAGRRERGRGRRRWLRLQRKTPRRGGGEGGEEAGGRPRTWKGEGQEAGWPDGGGLGEEGRDDCPPIICLYNNLHNNYITTYMTTYITTYITTHAKMVNI